MEHTIAFFIKIADLKWITDLYENGTVYMNTLNYFRKTEDGSLRGDPNEGAINRVDSANATIKLPFLDKEIKPKNIQYGSSLETGNLYCLYCVSSHGFPRPEDFKFDEDNLRFGSHCLMIKQPGVFIGKVGNELNRLGYAFDHGFAEYYQHQDRLLNLTPFDKSETFGHQKEFRFFVENEMDSPLKINIGSMESYAEIYEAKDLLSLKLRGKSV